jgi:hypothetical protein
MGGLQNKRRSFQRDGTHIRTISQIKRQIEQLDLLVQEHI